MDHFGVVDILDYYVQLYFGSDNSVSSSGFRIKFEAIGRSA